MYVLEDLEFGWRQLYSLLDGIHRMCFSVRQVVETACAFVGVVEAIEMMEQCESRGRRRLVRGSSDIT